MRIGKRSLFTLLAILLFAGLSLIPVLKHQWSSWKAQNCATDSHIVAGLSGSKRDVRVEEVVCDDFVHSDVISVFVRAGESGGETLAFRYAPDSMSHPPQIAWLNAEHLLISVDIISDVQERQDAVDGVRLSYRIGRVLLP